MLTAIALFSGNVKNTKPVANPLQVSRPALESFCCAWLQSNRSSAAKAFPIAFWTPDATGAMTAAVIPSVVHDLVNPKEL
jgi:hypothetical protein